MLSTTGSPRGGISTASRRGEINKGAPERMELARLRQIYGISATWWVISSAFRGVRGSVYPLRWLPKGPNSVLVYGAATSVMAAVMATLVDSGIRAELL